MKLREKIKEFRLHSTLLIFNGIKLKYFIDFYKFIDVHKYSHLFTINI